MILFFSNSGLKIVLADGEARVSNSWGELDVFHCVRAHGRLSYKHLLGALLCLPLSVRTSACVLFKQI